MEVNKKLLECVRYYATNANCTSKMAREAIKEYDNEKETIAVWFSCGVASAVAAKKLSKNMEKPITY